MKTNEKLQVLIEIPKGSRNKYELSKKTGLMMLDRVLPESMDYPADYGFILGTNAPDGDELDVFVLISNPTFSGCLIEARPIGVLKMKDERGTDDKILAVAIKDQTYSNIKDISDLSKSFLAEIKHFLEQYKALEKRKYSIVGKWHNKIEALKVIEASKQGK